MPQTPPAASPRQRSTKPRRVHVKPCIYRNTTEDGRIRYQFTYVDSEGKRRWQTVEGGLREAEAARDDMRVKLRRGERIVNTRIPLSELAEAWLATQTHLRPSTTEGYERALRTQILPRLGRLLVSEISVDDIARLDPRNGGLGIRRVDNPRHPDTTPPDPQTRLQTRHHQ